MAGSGGCTSGGTRKREDDGYGEDMKRPRLEAPAASKELVKDKDEAGSTSSLKRSQEECDEDDVWSAIESSLIALDDKRSCSTGGSSGDVDYYSLELDAAYDDQVAPGAWSPSLSPLRDQDFEDWIATTPLESTNLGLVGGQYGKEAPLAIVS